MSTVLQTRASLRLNLAVSQDVTGGPSFVVSAKVPLSYPLNLAWDYGWGVGQINAMVARYYGDEDIGISLDLWTLSEQFDVEHGPLSPGMANFTQPFRMRALHAMMLYHRGSIGTVQSPPVGDRLQIGLSGVATFLPMAQGDIILYPGGLFLWTRPKVPTAGTDDYATNHVLDVTNLDRGYVDNRFDIVLIGNRKYT
jgi:hypothetical protein